MAPVGACAVALALTVLGFAHVPFKVSLAIVIALGVVVAVVAFRRRPGAPSVRCAVWPSYVALLLAAISLIPLFRAGFVTVEGQGQDAHLAVGTAQFLQKHPPTAVAIPSRSTACRWCGVRSSRSTTRSPRWRR